MKTERSDSLLQTRIPLSIQKRLPLTYALIALLVALSMGGVLVGILSEYYRQQEIAYLSRNADVIGASLSQIMEADTDEDLQARVNLFAFVSRTQVEILDTDDKVIVSSDALTSILDDELMGVRVVARQTGGEEFWIGSSEPTLTTSTEFVEEGAIIVETLHDEDVSVSELSMDFLLQASGTPNFTHSILTQEEQIFVNQEPGLYGFGLTLSEDEISPFALSSQSITVPLTDSEGDLIGSLHLSQGPAYGVEIVTSVAWGWLIASLISITLAIIVGYRISLDVTRPLHLLTSATKQMASGDITARTNLARQDELGVLATAFNDMANKIEATVSTLHHFVSDAAHEINTPITALRTNLELIHREQSVTKNQIILERALDQVIRLENLTRNLLQLSRLESGVKQDTPQPIDMIALVRETVGFYASRADQANIDLELTFPRRPIVYNADDVYLRIALSNLLDNAIKFTPNGGRVSITLESSAQEMAIHIRDTGIGIPPDHLPYVFNRFHRASNVADYDGSGLGLSIVQTIVERYGGHVSIRNLECGTRFSIFLPL